MTIDEKTFEAFRNIFIKINDDHIPVEEVIANELKTTSYIQIFIQKIKEFINSFWSEKIMIATFIFIFIFETLIEKKDTLSLNFVTKKEEK